MLTQQRLFPTVSDAVSTRHDGIGSNSMMPHGQGSHRCITNSFPIFPAPERMRYALGSSLSRVWTRKHHQCGSLVTGGCEVHAHLRSLSWMNVRHWCLVFADADLCPCTSVTEIIEAQVQHCLLLIISFPYLFFFIKEYLQRQRLRILWHSGSVSELI